MARLNIMCNLVEGIAEEAMAEGLIKGAVQNSEKIAIKMLKKGNDFTEIQELTELSRSVSNNLPLLFMKKANQDIDTHYHLTYNTFSFH